MSQIETLIVDPEESGTRLDSFLKAKFPHFSRCYFQELIQKELVLINQKQSKKRTLVEEGDEIEVAFSFHEETSLLPQKIDLDILYEDPYLIAINKPAGLVVHPGCNQPSNTLANALLYYLQETAEAGNLRPGIIHRLDKDTTGIILCAKTREAQEKMVSLFAERKIQKTYLAITLGAPSVTQITTLIGRDPHHRQAMAVLPNSGKEAETLIELLSKHQELAALRLHPKTGRTHQLRVHLKHLHCPILGDQLYGNKNRNQHYSVETQLLHAHRLEFIHPFTQASLCLDAPPPETMQRFLIRLGVSSIF